MATQNTDNRLIEQRRNKLTALREEGFVFPNQFQRLHYADVLHQKYGHEDKTSLEEQAIEVKLAGRIMSIRVMGKSIFCTVRDRSGDIQLFIQKNNIHEQQYSAFKHWDIGDIIAVCGCLMKTRTGELSIKASSITLLTKSLRPLPEKFHGLKDIEQRYRRRYLDLVMNPEARAVFIMRSQMISMIRNYLDTQGFLEVETPMMHPIAGGAKAKPFVTHHNVLDTDLYLRIAPELYLKRLLVGGFEKVYEINRNFRNEGVSSCHNPEFTMLEFYEAYNDYQGLMDFTESLVRHVCTCLHGKEKIDYGDLVLDFSQTFARMSMQEAVLLHNPGLTVSHLDDSDYLTNYLHQLSTSKNLLHTNDVGVLLNEIFEKSVEEKLVQPTFITAYPASVSPLARRSDNDSAIADRFEFFIAGKEIANGFSELNDPEDQQKRLHRQMQDKAAGDEEAMDYDEDYITALEYGMPPAAGEGIGIDRLAMIMSNTSSIRDVILFPQMKKVR